jgi:hypothetical protein
MTNSVSIKLGESAASFIRRYPSAKVVRQPAGLDFYSIDWDKRPRGVVTIEHGKNTIVIDDVLGVSTSEDQSELKGEGFFEYSVYAGITEPDLISHDEARIKLYALLVRLLEQGWKPTVGASDPRLFGTPRLEYVLAGNDAIGLDPLALPTLHQWMNIPSRTSWSFYAEGVFLEVAFTREPTLTDPKKPGSYLLTFGVKTAAEHFRGYVESEDRVRWAELVPAILLKLKVIRTQREADLKSKGVPIDETYQDPPIPAR